MDLSCFLNRMNYLNDDLKMGSNKPQHTTQYIQNRRDSSKFKGCSPLQSCNGLISLKPAIAYFVYTCPLPPSVQNDTADNLLHNDRKENNK